jgi:type IV pilus assembly protein PilC
MRKVATVIQERVIGGDTLSVALGQFPKVFPRLMVSLLEASEASGQMSEMLTRIAQYLEKDRQTARQIKGALTYPAIMLSMALGVSGFLIAWVLPRFARIYAQRDAALPAPTQFVLGLSNGLRENILTIALSVGAVVGLTILLLTTSGGKRFAHLLKVKLPVIGPIFTLYYLTRASRTLGTLLAAGVQLLDAVRIVRGVTNNMLWDELWNDLETNLTSGGTVAESVLRSPLLPPSSAQMIAAGERSGRLPGVLEKIANATDRDLDDAIKQGTQLIEPAMIILMGGLIGGLALALLLPIFTMARTMSGSG